MHAQLPSAEGLRRSVPQEFVNILRAQGGRIEGERRQVTVMFVDVSRFTPMSEQLDPEQVTDIINRCFSVLGEVIYKYEGTINRFMGDGIMVLFGAPITHEDDAERAVHAALEMRERLKPFNKELSKDYPEIPELSLHIGINTGLVVAAGVGTSLQQDYTVMGISVNLASRLEDISEAGEILIGEDTYRLVQQVFEVEKREPVKVRGISEPVTIYEVKSARPGVVRPRGIEGLYSEMVGREEEFAKLQGCIDSLLAGLGQIITVIGEAGIGKSRLVAEIRGYTSEKDLTWIEGRALSYGGALTYWPWMEILRKATSITEEDSNEQIIEKLRTSVEELLPDCSLPEIIPFLASVLSVNIQGDLAGEFPKMPPEAVRRHVFNNMRDFISAMAHRRPLILVLEDMHWSDPSSVELAQYLMELTDTVPLMLISIFRPHTDVPGWQLKVKADADFPHRHTEIRLEPLSVENSARLVDNLLVIENLDSDAREMILAKTEGNPFFLEEALRSLLDRGIVVQREGKWHTTRKITMLDVPDTVQGVLLARIDRLQEDVRRVLQMASVIGRTFLYRVLKYIAGVEKELNAHLSQLQRVQLIREKARIPELEYIFKHVLAQEAAYTTLLLERKKELHLKVASCIETLYADRLEEYYGIIAHHYERAEVWEKAVEYLKKEGDKAVRLYANEAAIVHLTKGLELLKSLPEKPERAKRELDLQIALGIPLIAAKGNAAPEVGATYARARELCEQVGETSQLFQVLVGLRRFYFARGELLTAHEQGEQLLVMAQGVQDSTYLSRAQAMLVETLYYLGEFAQVQEQCEQVIALYDPKQQRSQVFLYGTDSSSITIFEACALWHLGYPDQALKMSNKALASTQELSHPFNLAHAFFYVVSLHQFRREVQVVREKAEALIQLATEQGFPLFFALGTILRGWALAEQGQGNEGIAQMRQGLDAWRATGGEVFRSYFLSLLAEAYGKVGQAKEGLAVLSETLAIAHKNGERFHEAELYRIKGELLLMQNEDEAEIETCFQKAIDVACQQQAKSFELRAVMSLSRLWQKQGKKEEARTLLQEVYGWFKEGFDTADLKEAKALLEALS